MLRVLTKITFTQQPSDAYPNRKDVLTYDFVHQFGVESTWKNMTDTGEIILPRNVYIKDKTGKKTTLGGTNVNLGGFTSNVPVLLRGDKVKIEWGNLIS